MSAPLLHCPACDHGNPFANVTCDDCGDKLPDSAQKLQTLRKRIDFFGRTIEKTTVVTDALNEKRAVASSLLDAVRDLCRQVGVVPSVDFAESSALMVTPAPALPSTDGMSDVETIEAYIQHIIQLGAVTKAAKALHPKASEALAVEVAKVATLMTEMKMLQSQLCDQQPQVEDEPEMPEPRRFVEPTAALPKIPVIDASDFKHAKMLVNGQTFRIDCGVVDSHPLVRKKFFSNTPDHDAIHQFQGHMELTASLGGADGTIMTLAGVSGVNTQAPALYFPYMAYGNLRDLLQKTKSQRLPLQTRLRMAISVTKAVSKMHALGFMHRDVSALHVLVDGDYAAKLLMSTSSRELSGGLMTVGVGPVMSSAPETLRSDVTFEGRANYSEKADIYSLGLLLIELDTHDLPYAHKKDRNGRQINDSMLTALLSSGKDGDDIFKHKFHSSPSWFQALALECVSVDPEARPSAAEVLRRLQDHVDAPGVASLSTMAPIGVNVRVLKASNLAEVQSFGVQDVMCKLAVGMTKHTTSTCRGKQGASPSWPTDSIFFFPAVHLLDMTIEVNLLTSDSWFFGKQIGRAQLSLADAILADTKQLQEVKVYTNGAVQGSLYVVVHFTGGLLHWISAYIEDMTTYLHSIRGTTSRSDEIRSKLSTAIIIRDKLFHKGI
ncbi:serine/threonine protein kinase [Saprolegnia diclina VS20]|uniref:Serine/threonine protein kinase n=1 Tax=Saprolegnia diclina (strain VS20) TaxID=1156394 RepID=T0PYE1_SAPDV|nr:serine/threonine protein kinase [Saprolegnia diclina VS20]EQC26080.1 serine/threonine protein kinase [Saprolegnia diclina VS20]|eukprot:XP_008620447.1 serine/threonine protein kinase [Saprolegnia diclina VS20]